VNEGEDVTYERWSRFGTELKSGESDRVNDVIGFADTAAGDLRPDIGLGRELFDEALE
jgi:hypothetical protein